MSHFNVVQVEAPQPQILIISKRDWFVIKNKRKCNRNIGKYLGQRVIEDYTLETVKISPVLLE